MRTSNSLCPFTSHTLAFFISIQTTLGYNEAIIFYKGLELRFLFLLFTLLSLSWSKTSYELGKELYNQKACYGCHGHQLEGIQNYPYLANRAKGYLSYKLKYFRSGKADSQRQEMMIALTQGLSDTDIENLVTYFNEFVEEKSDKRYDDSYEVHGDGGS